MEPINLRGFGPLAHYADRASFSENLEEPGIEPRISGSVAIGIQLYVSNVDKLLNMCVLIFLFYSLIPPQN
jgi:hypothetical protein